MKNTRDHESTSADKNTDSIQAIDFKYYSNDRMQYLYYNCQINTGRLCYINENKVTYDNKNIFCLAAEKESFEIINFIINYHININNDVYEQLYEATKIKGSRFLKSLICVLSYSQYPAIELMRLSCVTGDLNLIEKFAKQDENWKAFSEAILKLAVRNKQKSLIQYVLNNGVDINRYKHELLEIAIIENDIDIFNIIFQYGNEIQDINNLFIKAIDCKTLGRLIYYKHYDIIESLAYHPDKNRVSIESIIYGFFEAMDITVSYKFNGSFKKVIKSRKFKNSYKRIINILFILLDNKYVYKNCIEGIVSILGILGSLKEIKKLIYEYDFNSAEILNLFVILASMNGNLKLLKFCSNLGADLNVDSGIALVRASEACEFKMMNYLIEKGIKPSISRLDFFLEFKDNRKIGVYKVLLEKGADIHENNEQPLRNACSLGEVNIVRFLVDRGADQTINNPETVIEAAARGGNVEILDFLLAHNVDINIKISHSLKIAMNNNHEEFIIHLINHVKEITLIVPILVPYIAKKSSLSILSAVLSRNIRIGQIERELLLNCLSNSSYEFIDILLNMGFNIHLENNFPYETRFLIGNSDNLEYILKEKSESNCRKLGFTKFICMESLPHVFISSEEYKRNIEVSTVDAVLIVCSVNSFITNPDTYQFTEYFLTNRQLLVIKLIVNKNTTQNILKRALFCACMNSKTNFEVVKYLITKGAHLQIEKK